MSSWGNDMYAYSALSVVVLVSRAILFWGRHWGSDFKLPYAVLHLLVLDRLFCTF